MLRFKNISEFASDGYFEALPNLVLTPSLNSLNPTDKQGKTEEIIKYETNRSGSVTLKYAAMSYGYLPTSMQVIVKEGENPAPFRLILRRDLTIALPSAPYWRQYHEIRKKFASSNWKEGEAEGARLELISAAEAAVNAGDRKIAARIYSWIPYLPTATYFANNIASGYSRENERSERNINLL